MKKRIANGIELIFILVAFILLWIPCFEVQHVDMLRYMPIETSAAGIMKENGHLNPVFVIFAINALMCIISIISKPEHKDGKMHIIMPIVLFFYSVMTDLGEGKAVSAGSDFVIAKSNFPALIYLFCLAMVIVISIAKRSSIIVGLPSKKEKEKVVINTVKESTAADELIKYKELLDSGAITQEEFDEKKSKLLNS